MCVIVGVGGIVVGCGCDGVVDGGCVVDEMVFCVYDLVF